MRMSISKKQGEAEALIIARREKEYIEIMAGLDSEATDHFLLFTKIFQDTRKALHATHNQCFEGNKTEAFLKCSKVMHAALEILLAHFKEDMEFYKQFPLPESANN